MERIFYFHPISLCNVTYTYKIIANAMANRLRGVLGEVISESQSTFIPGRLISNNIIVGFECIHALRNRKWDVRFMALKLDMSKAYDQVEWVFLKKMIARMGFFEV